MALHFASDDGIAPINSTVVAIDKDKNSHYAVRWTIDHLLINNPQIILIHVRHKYLQHRRYPLFESNLHLLMFNLNMLVQLRFKSPFVIVQS